MATHVPFSELVGKVLISVKNIDNKRLVFIADDGSVYELFHDQSCCDNVRIEDITGDLFNLLDSPITMADESSNPEYEEFEIRLARNLLRRRRTWTFYRLATLKGYVDIRWLGVSNGYYSERVDFVRTKNARPEQLDANRR